MKAAEFLVTVIVFLHFVKQDASKLPTVLVVMDNRVGDENRRIPKIFQEMNNFKDTNAGRVQFDTVSLANESTVLEEVCDTMQDGVVALVDMTAPRAAPVLRSVAHAAGVAYISVVDDSYMELMAADEGLEWRVQPVSVQMLRIVADIVIREQLNNVALVYDDTFDIQNTPRRILTNVPAQHLYMRISQSDGQIMEQVKMLRDTSIKSVFIIANNENAKRFLGKMSSQKSDTLLPDLFVLTKDGKVNCEGCITSMRIVSITGKTSVGPMNDYIKFIKDSGISHEFDSDDIKMDEAMAFDIARLIRISVTDRMLPVTYSCFDNTNVVSNRNQSKELVDTLKKQKLNGVFGEFETRHDHGRYTLTLILSELILARGLLTTQRQIADWTVVDGLNVSIQSLTMANRKRHYRVVTVPDIPPFVYKDPSGNRTGNKTGNQYYGYCIELLEALAKEMDFEYFIYDAPDGQFGSMAEDGTWSGVIKELMDKRADIAVGPISVMAERENVVDFTVPYYDLVGLTILMRKPSFDYSLDKFLRVLDGGVWGCIVGAFFVFSFLICVFDRLSPFSYQNNRKEWKGEGQEPRIFTFKEGIWFCMMSLTPQGGGETPRALSGRLVAATWWLFGFIIIATYTANLAAILTVSRLETPIESLDDLSKQFKVKYAPMNGSNAEIYFSRMAAIEDRFYDIWKQMSLSNDMAAVERAKMAVWDYPVSDKYTKLWNTMKTSPFPITEQQAIDMVLAGDFAFISDATTNKYATFTNCELSEVGEEFSRKPYALAVQEGSPLRGELSNVILQLINQRKLEEMKTKWWDRDRLECPDIESESDGISIRNIGGVFLVIVVGSGLALIMLAMECYWYKYKPKQKKKLYNVSSKTALTGAGGTSVTSLASVSDTNGIMAVDHSFGRRPFSTADDGLSNYGIHHEMTEKL